MTLALTTDQMVRFIRFQNARGDAFLASLPSPRTDVPIKDFVNSLPLLLNPTDSYDPADEHDNIPSLEKFIGVGEAIALISPSIFVYIHNNGVWNGVWTCLGFKRVSGDRFEEMPELRNVLPPKEEEEW